MAPPDAAATPLRPGPEPVSSSTGGAAGPGSAAGFLFGGGFALLVAALALAGPPLRRRIALPPVVCRPAAFLAVLERPG